MSRAEIEEFHKAVGALRGADKTVTAELAKNMRSVARPVVAEVRGKVRSSKGRSDKALRASEVERQLHVLSKVKEKGVGSIYDPATGLRSERRVRAVQRRLIRMTGLRESIATATGSSVSAGDKRTALAFRVSARRLPPSQRKLPRRWDAESGWRHPVFGNRDVWVRQYGSPYFRKTIYARKDTITGAVIDAMNTAAERVIHPEEKPA